MKDTKKINKTRRQRGYAFESSIVKKFNQSSYWIAKRLGSPSTNLPDVMGIDNSHKTIIALEAKSTAGNVVYVPQDQIERCEQWIKHFQLYEIKQVLLGFKFGQIKGKRKLKTFCCNSLCWFSTTSKQTLNLQVLNVMLASHTKPTKVATKVFENNSSSLDIHTHKKLVCAKGLIFRKLTILSN